jgi:ketosteroid isomerase-like protein
MQTVDQSQTDVALVQSLYAAFGRGDLETIYAAAAPDIEWEVIGPREKFPLFGMRRGVEGMKGFFKSLNETQEFSAFEPRQLYGAGDKVFALGHYALTMRKGGRSVETDWCHVFTIRDGKVASFREHTDTAQFVEAYRG